MNLPDREPWMQSGLCTQVGSDEWFPDKGQSSRTMKAVCRYVASIARDAEDLAQLLDALGIHPSETRP